MAVYINGKKVAGLGISYKSPYQIATDGGYQGTEDEFNEALSSIKTLDTNVGNAVSNYLETENGQQAIKDAVGDNYISNDQFVEELEKYASNEQLQKIENKIPTQFFYYGPKSDNNKKNLLWIDTDPTSGGLKFYDSTLPDTVDTKWVHVPISWT